MRITAAVLALLAAPTVLTACSSSSSGPAAPKDCSTLTGQQVAADANGQEASACKDITISNGFFPCSVAGKAVGSIYYVKTRKGNYAGRTGGVWKSATAVQAQHLGTMAKIAGCDVS